MGNAHLLVCVSCKFFVRFYNRFFSGLFSRIIWYRTLVLMYILAWCTFSGCISFTVHQYVQKLQNPSKIIADISCYKSCTYRYFIEIHFFFSGQQHRIHVKCCDHEPVTLIRNGFWPSTPKQPQVAFDQKLMVLLQYLFLECRASLKTIYQALQWLAPSLSKVYVSTVNTGI